MRENHPTSKSTDPEVLLCGKLTFVNPVMFEELYESNIVKAALRTKGSAGPSGLDAEGWRRMLISKTFVNETVNLRSSVALMAKHLCTNEIKTKYLHDKEFVNIEAYIACRLIPLEKNSGATGIGEVLRRIIENLFYQL